VLLVAFSPHVSAARRYAIERAAGGSGARYLGPLVGPARHGRSAYELPPPLELRVPGTQVLVVARRLRRSRAVVYAEPDYLLRGDATPNDPALPLQWGSSNTGQPIPTQEFEELLGPPASGTPGADDGALKAWQVSTGSRSIVIGETDTGVAYTHPDLAANIWSNPGGIFGCPAGTHGYDVLSPKSCDPKDQDNTYGGHGTHVAGIMGAAGNNGIGVAGINWQTTILPVKWMTNASRGGTAELIEAMQWLVAAKQAGVNVRVVNDSDTFWGTAYSQALSNEIDTLGANNILFVASAGNTGDDNDKVSVQRYPCSYDRPNEICVTASDNNDQLPSWANYGSHTVDLAAPGVSIYSTLRESNYGYLSGGSMAAPQVAGAAALILSVEPSLSALELKADILNNVDTLPQLSGRVITGGRLDICRALPGCPRQTALPTLPPAPPSTGVTQVGSRPQPPVAAISVISGLTISPRAFVAAGGSTRGRGVGLAGATVSYSDSEPAVAKFTVVALRSGIEGPEHTCAPPAHFQRGAGGRRCIYYLVLDSFARHDRVGRNRFHFSGRLRGRTLAPGRYRLEAVPVIGARAGIRAVASFLVFR
jgi:subtilisin family serine protease